MRLPICTAARWPMPGGVIATSYLMRRGQVRRHIGCLLTEACSRPRVTAAAVSKKIGLNAALGRLDPPGKPPYKQRTNGPVAQW